MPTGYTAAIKDGISFEQFALNCARAFGALVMMRDDPHDAQIPDQFEPSTWHANQLVELNSRLASLQAMSNEEAEAAALREHLDSVESAQNSSRESAELRSKYIAMLAQAHVWAPPTPDHEGMKTFMVQQIQDSIKWDCHADDDARPQHTLESGGTWRATQMANTAKSIEYHTRHNEDEIKRAAERTAWIKALRASLVMQNNQP